MRIHRNLRPLLLLLALAVVACGGKPPTIPGTPGIPRTEQNEAIIKRLEQYRLAVEQQDAAKLYSMADEQYWEDSGTPTGADDYGHQRLREVLTSRFQEAKSVRYSMRYMNIRRKGKRAYVEVLVDAGFSIKDARGKTVREDKRDQNQLVLRWDENRKAWMFLSGY